MSAPCFMESVAREPGRPTAPDAEVRGRNSFPCSAWERDPGNLYNSTSNDFLFFQIESVAQVGS